MDDNLLIFSDTDADIGGYEVIDILADLSADFVRGNDQLESYNLRREMLDNGTAPTKETFKVRGWKIDKFKFLPQVSWAWRMRPEKR